MTTARADGCTPGSHTHSDQPNLRPAKTIDQYLANCQAGLEKYSDRRAATILGWSRVQVWRAKLMAEIPEALFDRLMEQRRGSISTKALAQIALALRGDADDSVERCPHCGEVLRMRPPIPRALLTVVNEWLEEQSRGPAARLGAAPVTQF